LALSDEATPALTRKELDQEGCHAPGCTQDHGHGPLFLNGRCHPGKSQLVYYFASGIFVIRCKACHRHVMNVAADPEEQLVFNEKLACTDPTCKEPPENHNLRLSAPCHRKAGLFVAYNDGHLVMVCCKCKEHVATHHVKEASAQA
jgi:hypothetical protein